MKPAKTLAKKAAEKGALPLGMVASIYAVWLIRALSLREVTPPIAALHLVFWTLGPPLWFFLEYWALSPLDGDNLQDLKYKQGLAAKIWAAVLVSILYFFPAGPLHALIQAVSQSAGQ